MQFSPFCPSNPSAIRCPFALALVLLVFGSLPPTIQADIITFTHVDTTTDYSALPGGGTGHTFALRFSDADTGVANRSVSNADFLDATFTSGAYIATYPLADTAAFTTNSNGDVTSSAVSNFSGTDNAGAGQADIASFPPFDLFPSTGGIVPTNQPSWAVAGNNAGWSASAPPAAVPEPGSIALVATSLGAFGFHRFRHRKKAAA